jgi:HEPN domain-containing protein
MDDATRELVRAWLIKARNDLNAAGYLGSSSGAPLDAAIYHCQQAAEKAVKGFLASHGHELIRTHDIERLVEAAFVYDSSFF